MPLFVTKRNNEKQEFNLTKLRDQINFACKDLDVNPIVLESRLQSGIRNNIKTSELQELLIHSTLHLITTDESDWLHVAGRLSMYQLHREVYKNTKIHSYNQLKINQINRMSDFELFFLLLNF